MSARWWNVNEEGEAYDSHPTEAQARLVQAEFPNDTVVQASNAEEAERLAYPEVPTRMEQAIALLEAEAADTTALGLATESMLLERVNGTPGEDSQEALDDTQVAELTALANRLAHDRNVLRVAIRAAKEVQPGPLPQTA